LKGDKQTRGLICPKCGSKNIDVTKTWSLVSPIPDREGRITVTVMGVLKCRDCGYSWRGVVSKLKVSTQVEVKGGKREEIEERRPPREIVIDLDEITEE